MRKGVIVIGVVAAAVLGAWLFWPKAEPTPLTKRAATAADDGDSRANETSKSRTSVASNEAEAQPLVASKNAAAREQDIIDPRADEDGLVDEMRAVLKSDPKRAEQLGRAHRQRFPDGARSDEADALLVYAIYNQRRVLLAREAVLEYYERHPGGEYTERLIQLTRVKPPTL